MPEINGSSPSELAAVKTALGIRAPERMVFSAPGLHEFVIPPGAKEVELWMFGGGGGGGSGRCGALGTLKTGGAGGGPGATYRNRLPVSVFGGEGATLPVVVGAGGAGGAAVTTDSTSGSAGRPGQITGVGTVFAYGDAGTTVQTFGIAYGVGKFVQVGDGGLVLTSTTGKAPWTSHTAGAAQLRGLVFASNLFVAVGVGGAIYTSPDGTSGSWTARTSGTTEQLNAIAWDGTQFIAVGNAGTIITSTDAVTWATNAYSSAANLLDINYDGTSVRAAVSSIGEVVHTTTPTGTWTAVQVTTPVNGVAQPISSIAFGAGRWVAVGRSGNCYSATSIGGPWTATRPFGDDRTGVRFVNGWFLVGSVGGLTPTPYSADGIEWDFVTTPFVTGVGPGTSFCVYANGRWVFTKRTDNSTNPSQAILYLDRIVPYSVTAVGGSSGQGGLVGNANGGTNTFTQFAADSGRNSGPSSGGSAGFGMTVGGAGGGVILANNTSGAAGFGGQPAFTNTPIAVPGTTGVLSSSGAVAGVCLPGDGISVIGSEIYWGGSSGGGGGAGRDFSNASIDAQDAGSSGHPAAGGSGGGAADNGFRAGAGAAGGNGEVRLTVYF